jgi:hypothetical protein
VAPQVRSFDLFRGDDDSPWGHATSCGWVRVEAIVEAGGKVWGQFSRMGKTWGPVWTPRAAAEMLAVPEDQLPAFLRHHLCEAGTAVDLTTLNTACLPAAPTAHTCSRSSGCPGCSLSRTPESRPVGWTWTQ